MQAALHGGAIDSPGRLLAFCVVQPSLESYCTSRDDGCFLITLMPKHEVKYHGCQAQKGPSVVWARVVLPRPGLHSILPRKEVTSEAWESQTKYCDLVNNYYNSF